MGVHCKILLISPNVLNFHKKMLKTIHAREASRSDIAHLYGLDKLLIFCKPLFTY